MNLKAFQALFVSRSVEEARNRPMTRAPPQEWKTHAGLSQGHSMGCQESTPEVAGVNPCQWIISSFPGCFNILAFLLSSSESLACLDLSAIFSNASGNEPRCGSKCHRSGTSLFRGPLEQGLST